MSTGPKISRGDALALLEAFCTKTGVRCSAGGPDSVPRVYLTGSLRRGNPQVSDIDVLAPLPADGQDDRLFELVAHHINSPEAAKVNEVEGNIFTGTVGGRVVLSKAPISLGSSVIGWKPGFKLARLDLSVAPILGIDRVGKGKGGGMPLTVRMEISRYVPGPEGNAGWTALRTTGPERFSEAVLTYWKYRCGTHGTKVPGSEDGFLVRPATDIDGDQRPGLERVPTPNEQAVFRLIDMPYLEPQERTDEAAAYLERLIPWKERP